VQLRRLTLKRKNRKDRGLAMPDTYTNGNGEECCDQCREELGYCTCLCDYCGDNIHECLYGGDEHGEEN